MYHTLKMEQHIRLVVLEHLGNQFDIHVLDIDLLVGVNTEYSRLGYTPHQCVETDLETLVHDHNSFIQFLLYLCQLWLPPSKT